MENYELEAVSPTEIFIKSADNKILERLSLAKEPPHASLLVQEARKDVLQTLDLKELFDKLGICVPLLNITYDAVNGTGYEIKDGKLTGGSLSAAITKLKNKFSNAVDDSLVVMTGFKTGTQTAVNGFLQAYDYLTDPDYVEEPVNGVAMAGKKFQSIKNTAVEMHKEAEVLASGFKEIETTAQEVTTVIMSERDLDNAKKEELMRTVNSMKAQSEAFSKVTADLEEEIKKYDEDYNNVSRQAEKASKQGFGLQLASAVIGGATTLFNSVAGAFSAKAMVGGVINNAMSKTDPAQQQQGQGPAAQPSSPSAQPKSEDLEKSNKIIAEGEKRITEIDARLNELKPLIESETAEEKKRALLDEQDSLAKEKKTKTEEMESARKQAAIYEGIASGAQQIAGQLDQMSQKAGDATTLLYGRLDKIAEQRAEISKTRRETTMKLAEITSKLANATTEQRDLEVVLNALVMAISCMRIVSQYLSDIALFWKNVERFCDRLIAGIESIEEDSASRLESKNYTKFFVKEGFVTMYLVNIANWVALHLISVEYLDAFNKTRKEYQQIEITNRESDPKVHWKRAQENALLLQQQFDIELGGETVK